MGLFSVKNKRQNQPTEYEVKKIEIQKKEPYVEPKKEEPKPKVDPYENPEDYHGISPYG